MLKKISIVFVILMFILVVVLFVPHQKFSEVVQVNSPCNIDLQDEKFVLKGLECFDDNYSLKNKDLAKNLKITEKEAFILGNLGKYWAKNLLEGRKVYVNNNDIQYYKYDYSEKFKYSGFCLQNGKPCSSDAFEYQLNNIRKANFKVLDLDNENIYNADDEEVEKLSNYLVLRKSHLPLKYKEIKTYVIPNAFSSKTSPILNYREGSIKVYFTDFTSKLKPDRNCNTDMCKEILNNIQNAKSSIDIAIYGYSRVPAIETALENAIKRGVSIRLVYDLDSKGENIYPDTKILLKLLEKSSNDGKSVEVGNIMHNKFYIFDDKILITGSANLAHTDMSGYNSNAMIVFDSLDVAKMYKTEFEQMFNGKYHNSKIKTANNLVSDNLKIFFSPQDKSMTNGILPLIKNAKSYIYIPTFVLTENRLCQELIQAYNRGVDVRIIADALNTSTKHTKVFELRKAGIPVKIENYAGKMHSKSIISDDREVVIGSMNFSNSGENKNDENLVIIKNQGLAKFYKEIFLYQWDKIDNKWLKYIPKAEGKDSIGSCSDGLDNDYDGLIDLEDSGCR